MPKYKFLKLFGLLLTLSFGALKSQNPQYRQLYAQRHFTNPALVGLGKYDQLQATRIATGIKAQWLNLERRLVTSNIEADYNPGNNTSWGLNVFTTDLNSGSTDRLKYQHFSSQLTYSYLLKTSSISYKFGISAQYSNFTFGTQNYVWEDQINQSMTGFVLPTQEPLSQLSKSAIHASIGALAFGEKWFAGAAVYNVNEPNISFYDQGDQVIGRKILIHGGLNLSNRSKSLTYIPNFAFIMQDGLQSIIANLNIRKGNIYYGGGMQQTSGFNQTSYNVNAFFGVRKNNWSLGYSNDINLSMATPGVPMTHEVSIVYLLPNKKITKSPIEVQLPQD